MPAVQLCAEFALFPDDFQLGPSFSLAGYDFVQPAGGTLMFVNVTGSEKGLQFPEQGIEITLPVPVTRVTLRLGAFRGPVEINALDSMGAVVRMTVINTLNIYINVGMAAPEIATITLSKGGNEGILVRICETITVVP
jgi:hypothetical protein